MRKKVFGRQFSRGKKGREALLRSLMRALVMHGSIETTYAKAKAIQGDVDSLITRAKEGTLFARRKVLANLANDKRSLEIIFEKIAPVFKEVKGGFTRIILLPSRRGDNSPMARIEWSRKVEINDKKQVTSKKDEKELKNKKSEKIDNKK